MRRIFVILSFVFMACGCQATHVREMSTQLGSTVPDLYYEQVLNNIALIDSSPSSIPYFGVPSQGTSTNTRLMQGSYNPGWDFLITPIATLSAPMRTTTKLLERYLFDKGAATVTGSNQDQEAFQVTPMQNPDNLLLMQYAFQRTTDKVVDRKFELNFYNFFDDHDKFRKYYNAINQPRWYTTTCDKWVAKRAKKNGCKVGHHGSKYVIVDCNHMKNLSDFTLAILDIATVDLNQVKKKRRKGEGPETDDEGARDELSQVITRELGKINKLNKTEFDSLSPNYLSSVKALIDIRNALQQSGSPGKTETYGAPRMSNPVVSPPPNAPTIP